MYKEILISFTLIVIFSQKLLADFSYECVELERVTVADSGLMTPAYPGRILKFNLKNNKIVASGVFYHNKYNVTLLTDSNGNTGFRAFASSTDRQDIFYFFNNQLFHSAIVNYGMRPSIQNNIFECKTLFFD